MRYSLLPLLLLLLASCGRADRMRHMLEQAEWMNRHDSLFTSDSVGRALVRYYDHWWHPADLRLRAYYMLGCAYRDMGNAPRALENYQLAVAQVDTLHAPDSTLNRLMRVHSQMSRIYLLQRLPELEEQELQTAERLAWRSRDTLSALIFEEWMCNMLCNKGKYNACLKETRKLQKKYLKCNYENEALLANALCIKSYLATGQFTKVMPCLRAYEGCDYFHTNPEKIDGGTSSASIFKGLYYIGVRQPDSAEFYFYDALSRSETDQYELLIYKGLFQSYSLQHNIDSVLKYTHLYTKVKESQYDEELSMGSIQAKALYDYSTEKQIAERRKEGNTRLALSLLATVLVATFTIVVSLYRNEKRKREISELHREYERVRRELEKTEGALATLNRERDGDKEYVDEILRNKEELRTHIAYLERELLKRNRSKGDVDLSETEIVQKFRKAREHGMTGKYKLIDEDWKQLRNTVEAIYPTFFEAMNARKPLSSKDYKICLLVKARFSPSDINILMGQTDSYSTQAKKRLHKKVFGFEGTAADFEKKINQE